MNYQKLTIYFFLIALTGYLLGLITAPNDNVAERHIAEQQAYIVELENRTVTEQMKSIQRQVGCKKIDADPGPETRRLVNAEVKAEEKELFNQYAAAYIEAPEIKEELK